MTRDNKLFPISLMRFMLSDESIRRRSADESKTVFSSSHYSSVSSFSTAAAREIIYISSVSGAHAAHQICEDMLRNEEAIHELVPTFLAFLLQRNKNSANFLWRAFHSFFPNTESTQLIYDRSRNYAKMCIIWNADSVRNLRRVVRFLFLSTPLHSQNAQKSA